MVASNPPTTAPLLTLRLFGPLEIQVRGEPLPRLRSRQGYAVLALLALRHGAEVERAWVSGTLWPDSDEALAMGSLRSSLNDLRRALGPEAERLRSPTPRTLALDLAGAFADVVAFDAAIARGDAASLQEAVALYRGPLLEGWVEEWVFHERQVREQAFLRAAETLAAQAREGGDLAEAERLLRRVVGIDATREATQRSLMEVLAAGGNDAAVIQVYRELRLRLHRELNAEPAPETSRLFQQIRVEARRRARPGARLASSSRFTPTAATAAAPAAEGAAFPPRKAWEVAPNNLPVPLTRFIGRVPEMAEVRKHLATSRLVTLTGAGGCGKTRLALQVAADLAEECAEEYPDGVWLVELAALTDPVLVAQSVASALKVREETSRPLIATLVDYLRPRSLLLVLDNCEHVLAACAQLAADLLRSCTSLCILATSREALGILGEQSYRVPSLSSPGLSRLPPTPESLCPYEAVRLFVDRARLRRATFTLTNENAAAVAQICQRLDGIPLALELAAVPISTLPAEQIARRLDDRFGLLTGGNRTALPRHQTLRATMDWGYELLSEAERTLLRRLSVFAGGFTLEAVETICAGEGINAPGVLDLLGQLVDKSLVLAVEQAGEARYRLLETIRVYGDEKLQGLAEKEVLHERHRDWFLRLVEAAEPELRGSAPGEWLTRLDREHDNLRAALAWSGAQGHGEASLRLGGALWWFWHLRGYWTEGRERLAGLLALPGVEARTAARATALHGAGHLAFELGQYGAARALLEESLAIHRELDNKPGIARSLNDLGLAAHTQGDYGTARALLEESVAVYRELGDKGGMAWALNSLGTTAYVPGHCGAARALFEESLALFRELGNKPGIANSLGHLGLAAKDQGDFGAARELLAESLAIYRELDSKPGIAWSLTGLGMATRDQGDYRAAQALFEESLALLRELGNKGGIAWSLTGMGVATRDQGDYRAAQALFEESLALFREAGNKQNIAKSLGYLGVAVRDQGDHGTARALFEESLAILRELDYKPDISWSLSFLGLAALDEGEYGAARARFEESLALFRELGYKGGIAKALEGLAAVAVAQAHSEHAARLFGAAEGLREAISAPLPPADRPEHNRFVLALRTALGDEAFAAAWAEGRAMSLEDAVAYALEASETG